MDAAWQWCPPPGKRTPRPAPFDLDRPRAAATRGHPGAPGARRAERGVRLALVSSPVVPRPAPDRPARRPPAPGRRPGPVLGELGEHRRRRRATDRPHNFPGGSLAVYDAVTREAIAALGSAIDLRPDRQVDRVPDRRRRCSRAREVSTRRPGSGAEVGAMEGPPCPPRSIALAPPGQPAPATDGAGQSTRPSSGS